jgi:hypothetical protein
VATLFQRGQLDGFLRSLIGVAHTRIDQLSEDVLLARSTEDLVQELKMVAYIEPLVIDDEWSEGSVDDTMLQAGVEIPPDPLGRRGQVLAYRVKASYGYRGDLRLFGYQPSHRLAVLIEGEVGDGEITVSVAEPQGRLDADRARQLLDQQIGRIREMARNASVDVANHNARIDEAIRLEVEDRKARVLQRRGLAGALGFALTKRPNPPAPVPLERRRLPLTTHRSTAAPYQDEPALRDSQYEEVIAVVRSTLLAMERTPSVASAKGEEELRDQILVQLNGTFEGAATGETFVQSGKTDILVKTENRHVFVAECKWWSGPKALSGAVDQLLSYLPWRDEKAALIVFIDRKDATTSIERADEAIRQHNAFKRTGKAAGDPTLRRDYVLGHPGDPDREIKLAALFAVLSEQSQPDAATTEG